VQSLDTIPITQRIGNAVLAYGTVLVKTVWPVDLAIFYPHPRENLAWPWAVLSGIALGIATFAAFRLRHARPSLWMGWAWFVVTLLPVIGILQVGGQAYADRYTYVPHIGLFAGLVFALPRLRSVQLRRGFAVAAGGVVALCTVVSFAQVRHWKDTETLFTRAIAVTQGNVLAHAVLSRHYAERGVVTLSEVHARAAVDINPEFADGWLELGSALFTQDRHRDAEAALDRFLALRPESATGWYYRARALDAQDDPAAAAASFERALAIAPGNAVVRTAYGNLLAREAVDRGGEGIDKAARQFELAIEADPGYRLAHLNLGRSLALMGRTGEAEFHLEQAASLAGRPENTP
jgi:tetratricopeptide (TPR) repeat protein